MNGGQDLGGMMGFGPIVPEQDEPAFHANWEKRTFALALAMGFAGAWSLDGSRAARESLPPAEYLTSSYYAIWLKALERQVTAHHLATPAELASGDATTSPRPLPRVLTADLVEPRFGAGFPSHRDPAAPARFSTGDHVVARNIHPSGHTRLPRYVRGRQGRILRVHDAFVFPDSNADGTGEAPQWLYTVEFEASELWGASGKTGDRVTIAAFESYLYPKDGVG